MDQGSTRKCSAVHNFAPTVMKFCVMWEGLPHDTKFGNCRGEIVDRRMIFIWSLIHVSGWSGLIKAEPNALSFTKIWKRLPHHHIHPTYHYNLFFDWCLFHDCYWECVSSSRSTIAVMVHIYCRSLLPGHIALRAASGQARTGNLWGLAPNKMYG